MAKENIVINNDQEKALIAQLESKADVNSQRIKRLLALPDLTKKDHSPIKLLVDTVMQLERFADFDVIEFPRIVKVEENFDVLNAPKDHPSRRETDTYYLNKEDV